jgi:hypothetical protein
MICVQRSACQCGYKNCCKQLRLLCMFKLYGDVHGSGRVFIIGTISPWSCIGGFAENLNQTCPYWCLRGNYRDIYVEKIK